MRWPEMLLRQAKLCADQEVDLIGAVGHGVVTYEGETRSTFELAMRWMQAGKLNSEGLLTHRFPLDGYREVFIAAVVKRRRRSIKVAFEMREEGRKT